MANEVNNMQLIPKSGGNNVQMATNSPTNNVNNIQPQGVQPITIPIQLQPTVASMNMPASQNMNTSTVQRYNAPTPVQYQEQNYNTPMYQNTFDNYKSQYNNIEYPKITIPENTNMNTLEGQYKSNYSNAINQIANTILNTRFEYNPNEDDLLKQASNYVTQNTFEAMNSKGILNSSMTAERVAQVVGNLIPQYEKLAREEFDASFSRLLNTANLLMNMDDREFTQWKDAREQKWKEEERDYQRKQDALNNAWKRVDELGFVDNESAVILGVKAGTLSKDAREAKEAYERQIAEWNRQHEIQKQTDIELLKLKQDMEKDLYSYKSNIDNDLTAYEKKIQLQKKYGITTSGSKSTKSNYTSISKYDSVIQNKWAQKDMNDKYVVTDNDAIFEYLQNEYNEGRLSEADASILIAKYGIKTPGSSTKKTESFKSSGTGTLRNANDYAKWAIKNNGNLSELFGG